MTSSSEYEHRKKLNKIREDMNKRVKDVGDHFSKIEKVKTDALKKIEDMRGSAEQNLRKLEEDIARSTLTAEAKSALTDDIAGLRREVEQRGSELKDRISKTFVPH